MKSLPDPRERGNSRSEYAPTRWDILCQIVCTPGWKKAQAESDPAPPVAYARGLVRRSSCGAYFSGES